MYDLFAGREALESSYVLTRSKALEAFPMLKKDELVGALVYYDGKTFLMFLLFCHNQLEKLSLVFSKSTMLTSFFGKST
jgi:hypothetical protein